MAVPKLINFSNLARVEGKPATLYRTNDRYGNIGLDMNALYNQSRGTYFVLHPAKLSEYFARVGSKGKGFRRKGEVMLLDMSDPATVGWTKEQFEKGSVERNALNTAFPENLDGTVGRFSSAETKHLDDIALAAITSIVEYVGAVGYYSAEQKNANGATIFHEEVGLAPAGFRLFSIAEHIKPTVSVGVERRKRSRNNNAGAGGGGGAGAGGAGAGGKRLAFYGGSRRTRRAK